MKQWTQGTQKEDQLALIANILSEHGERQKHAVLQRSERTGTVIEIDSFHYKPFNSEIFPAAILQHHFHYDGKSPWDTH